jgi:EAL domain-containing protein (putative c-di-GMP-specific phosphodiesterase class I)
VPVGNRAGGRTAVTVTRARIARLNAEGRVQLAVLAVVTQARAAIAVISALVAAHRPASDNWPGIVLDVTEDQLVRDIALTQKIAEDLKACGVAVAIDDFGAGYSSLTSLRGLPFAELKIHSSFIRNCAVDLTNAAICQTAIDLAHRFGSLAVAKGIDAIADLQALMVMGCDFGQGALVAPAMPKDRFLDALRKHMNKPAAPDRLPSDNAEHVA